MLLDLLRFSLNTFFLSTLPPFIAVKFFQSYISLGPSTLVLIPNDSHGHHQNPTTVNTSKLLRGDKDREDDNRTGKRMRKKNKKGGARKNGDMHACFKSDSDTASWFATLVAHPCYFSPESFNPSMVEMRCIYKFGSQLKKVVCEKLWVYLFSPFTLSPFLCFRQNGKSNTRTLLKVDACRPVRATKPLFLHFKGL